MLSFTCSIATLYVRMQRRKVSTNRLLSDNIILDLNKKNEFLGIEIIGPRPEDLKEFRPKSKILARACSKMNPR
jgi:hypothetical protein